MLIFGNLVFGKDVPLFYSLLLVENSCNVQIIFNDQLHFFFAFAGLSNLSQRSKAATGMPSVKKKLK